MAHSTKIWAAIPAAGIGARMGSTVPKQYLPLHGRTVIEHALARFLAHPDIAGVVVALAPYDSQWESLEVRRDEKLLLAPGGAERCHSVLSSLRKLAEVAAADDWVLVHDAARPCVRRADIDRMLNELREHPVGGILALPVRDTLKRGDPDANIVMTVDRTALWHALTPQMFRLQRLTDALESVIAQGIIVTDEAQAIELLGLTPRLVEGHGDNIKITRPQDLAFAELYLRHQEEAACG